MAKLARALWQFSVVHTRFSRWSKKGLWLRVFSALCEDSDNEYQMIDATIVRAHQHVCWGKRGGDEAIGRSVGGLSTKIHATCDALGNPTGFFLPRRDRPMTCKVRMVSLADIEAEALLADKAYDADERVRAVLKAQGVEPVIPSESSRTNQLTTTNTSTKRGI